MTNDFINIFIQKQKNCINELQSKLLIAEAQIELNNELLKKANEEIDSLKKLAEKTERKEKKSE